MKKLNLVKCTVVALLTLMPALTSQQAQAGSPQSTPRTYLTGAVPTENGKVVFTHTIALPGLTAKQSYEKIKEWMTHYLEASKNEKSRIVYDMPDSGRVIGLGEEWMIFSSNTFSLDRTKISYMLSAQAEEGRCTLRLERIKYLYREEERYTAEEMITDEKALRAHGKKLVLGLAKWRKKTVDFVHDLFDKAQLAIGGRHAEVPVPKVGASEVPVKEVVRPKSLATGQTVQPDAALLALMSRATIVLSCTAGCGAAATDLPVTAALMYGNGNPTVYCTLKDATHRAALQGMKTFVLQLIDPQTLLPEARIYARKVFWVQREDGATLQAEVECVEKK